MSECDEGIKCEYCYNSATIFYNNAAHPDFNALAMCIECQSHPNVSTLGWQKITREEFIAFRVMHS